jgi:hypothetical protein
MKNSRGGVVNYACARSWNVVDQWVTTEAPAGNCGLLKYGALKGGIIEVGIIYTIMEFAAEVCDA